MQHTIAALASGLLLLLGAAAGTASPPRIQDLNITDLVLCSGKGGGGKSAPTIIWSPSIVVTKRNTTLAVAQAQWKDGRNLLTDAGIMSRSVDGGRSFGANQVVGTGGAVLLASALTGTVHAFGLLPPGCPPVLTAPSPEAAALATRDRSTNSSCPSGNALTHSSSQDDGLTWSPAEVLRDPFVVGEGGLDHGIELQHGPHRGRLVLPYSEASQSKDKYAAHAMAVYSDNAGKNWSVGALLPDYSGEASITELANGSLLISFRSEGEHMTRHPHNRGFARSDTGGETWAEVWYANDRDPAIIDAPSDQGIDRSEKTGAVYFGHPGALDGDRANYTIHRSTDSGATFQYVGVIYPGGAGYSDVHVLPSDGPGDRLGVAFQRCLNDSTREGGGYNMAWASMTIL